MQTQLTADLIGRYRHLTGTVLPALARQGGTGWPVRDDHCFQRIVLDTICGGVWYHHLGRPAYRHLSGEQAARAVKLCEDMIAGAVDLAALNRQSLVWRALAWRGGLRASQAAGDVRSIGKLL